MFFGQVVSGGGLRVNHDSCTPKGAVNQQVLAKFTFADISFKASFILLAYSPHVGC